MPLGNSLEKKIKIWQNIKYKCPSGGTGIRVRLKIACPLDLWVQLPPRAHK